MTIASLDIQLKRHNRVAILADTRLIQARVHPDDMLQLQLAVHEGRIDHGFRRGRMLTMTWNGVPITTDVSIARGRIEGLCRRLQPPGS